jgi:hypothetical protein
MPRRPHTAGPSLETDIQTLFTRKEYSARYPTPDPQDPFAPLWVLRHRQGFASSQSSLLDSESQYDTSEQEQIPADKPKRSWRGLGYRRTQDKDKKENQAPDTTHSNRRPKSLPPPRRLNTVPTPPFFPGTGDGSTTPSSIDGFDSLQLKTDVIATDFTKEVPPRDESPNTLTPSRAIRYHYELRSQMPRDTIPASNKGLGIGRFLRPKKSSTNIEEPSATPSPKIAPIPLLDELSIDDKRLNLKPNTPSRSGSLATIRSTKTVSTVDILNPPPRMSSLAPPDVGHHPSLADLQRGCSSTRCSLDSQGSIRRRNGKLQKLPRRPKTSPGDMDRQRQGSSPSLPIALSRMDTSDMPPPIPSMPFEQQIIPTEEQLKAAASVLVVAENGVKVRFGALWEGKKTIVCFIRHFW